MFTKATKNTARFRGLLEGASGSGKTTAALTLANALGRTAVIDTERGSASLYSDRFDFDVLNLDPPYSPQRYIEAIEAAGAAGYDSLVIDSITHEWTGVGGCLDLQRQLGGRFQDWNKVSPLHQRFIDAMLSSPCHVLATCRTKQAYSMDEKGKVTKSGTDPQQRDGMDFEFTVVWRLTPAHLAVAEKDRTRIFDCNDQVIDGSTAEKLKAWLRGDAPDRMTPSLPTAQEALVAKAGANAAVIAQYLQGLGWIAEPDLMMLPDSRARQALAKFDSLLSTAIKEVA